MKRNKLAGEGGGGGGGGGKKNVIVLSRSHMGQIYFLNPCIKRFGLFNDNIYQAVHEVKMIFQYRMELVNSSWKLLYWILTPKKYDLLI